MNSATANALAKWLRITDNQTDRDEQIYQRVESTHLGGNPEIKACLQLVLILSRLFTPSRLDTVPRLEGRPSTSMINVTRQILLGHPRQQLNNWKTDHLHNSTRLPSFKKRPRTNVMSVTRHMFLTIHDHC